MVFGEVESVPFKHIVETSARITRRRTTTHVQWFHNDRMRDLFKLEKWEDFQDRVEEARVRTEACIQGSGEKLARYKELAREGDRVMFEYTERYGYVAERILQNEYSHFFSTFNTWGVQEGYPYKVISYPEPLPNSWNAANREFSIFSDLVIGHTRSSLKDTGPMVPIVTIDLKKPGEIVFEGEEFESGSAVHGQRIAQTIQEALFSHTGIGALYNYDNAAFLRVSQSSARSRIKVELSGVYRRDSELSTMRAFIALMDMLPGDMSEVLGKNRNDAVTVARTTFIEARNKELRGSSACVDYGSGIAAKSVERDAMKVRSGQRVQSEGDGSAEKGKCYKNWTNEDEKMKSVYYEEMKKFLRAHIFKMSCKEEEEWEWKYHDVACVIPDRRFEAEWISGLQMVDRSEMSTVYEGTYEGESVIVKTPNSRSGFFAELAVYGYLRVALGGKAPIPALVGVLDQALVLRKVGEETWVEGSDLMVGEGAVGAAEMRVIQENARRGLNEIHRVGVAHGDIALRNIRVVTGTWEVYWIDFGESAAVSVGSKRLAEEKKRCVSILKV